MYRPFRDCGAATALRRLLALWTFRLHLAMAVLCIGRLAWVHRQAQIASDAVAGAKAHNGHETDACDWYSIARAERGADHEKH